MKQTQMSQAIAETIRLKERAINIVITDVVKPLMDVGSPEARISKPYEQWTPEDLAFLSNIYGTGDNTVLANLVFRKTYDRVKRLEKEEGM